MGLRSVKLYRCKLVYNHLDLKDEPVTLMVLKREGFAKRVGKGDGQKWMMEFNLSFVLLFLAFGSLAYDLLYDNI